MNNKTFKEDSFLEEDITEEEKEERKKRLIVLIIIFTVIILGLYSMTFTRSIYSYNLYSLKNNIDLDNDGRCDLNCDIDGDGLADYNIDFNEDNIPDINITYKNGSVPYFNISTSRNGRIDKNPINQMRREQLLSRSVCVRNCDIDTDGWPDTNIDLDGDKDIDLNRDLNNNGICDLDCDVFGIPVPNYNVDTDNDGKPDVNIGVKGETIPLYNISYGRDYKTPYFNLLDDNLEIDYDNLPRDLKVINLTTTVEPGENTKNLKNVDLDKDGFPDINIILDVNSSRMLNEDLNGNQKADINLDIDLDKICDLNCDVNGDKKPDTNIDTTGDGKPNLNIDNTGDGKCNINCDIDGDGKPDINIDTTGDGNPNLNIDNTGDGKCNINCDIDGDGKPDTNIDTTGDGKPDDKIDSDGDGKIDAEIIDIDKNKVYELEFLDVTEDEFYIYPGWEGSKTFTVRNTTDETLIYSIDFTEVKNELSEENNLYYGLTKNDEVVIDIENTRAPYENTSLITNQEIGAGKKDTYVISFKFVETNINQDKDRDKEFYTKLQVKDAS